MSTDTTAPAAVNIEAMRRVWRWSRYGLFASFFGLLLVLTLTTWLWPPEGAEPTLAIWLLKIGPLLMFLPGLLRNNTRSCAWLCFVVMFYFLIGVLNAMIPSGGSIDVVQIGLSVAVFTFGIVFIRYTAKKRELETTNTAV